MCLCLKEMTDLCQVVNEFYCDPWRRSDIVPVFLSFLAVCYRWRACFLLAQGIPYYGMKMYIFIKESTEIIVILFLVKHRNWLENIMAI